MTIKEMDTKRLFVGNLFPEVTSTDLEKKFSRFGSVSKVEIKTKKDIDGAVVQTFAFIDLKCDNNGVSQCIAAMANKKWKGAEMTVQQARESFMERLARERKEKSSKPTEKTGDGHIISSDRKHEHFPNVKKINSTEFVESSNNIQGTVVNGVVSFEANESVNGQTQNRKTYHSSSEDEVSEVALAQPKKKQKTEKAAQNKEQLRQRFLEKQKLVESQKVETVKKPKPVSRKKVYEGSSDEEEDDVKENVGKSSEQVLKTMQSFSNVWGDSDKEEDDDDDSDSDEDSDESDSSSSDEEEEETKVSVKDKLKPVEGSQATSDLMQRYDPNAEDQEQFLRKENQEVESESQEALESNKKSSKSFQIKGDLKQAFNSQAASGSGGFSFGFLGSDSKEEVKETPKYYSDDEEEEELPKVPVIKKADTSSKFGMMLKSKGKVKASKPFFFTGEEDERLTEGVSFFFDHKVDLDELRTSFNEKRPILSDILKKRFRNKQKRAQGQSSGSKKTSTWNRNSDGKVKRRFKKQKRKN